MLYLVAGSYSNFRYRCRTDGLVEGRDAKYVSSASDLYGHRLQEGDKIEISELWWDTRRHDTQSLEADRKLLGYIKHMEAIRG